MLKAVSDAHKKVAVALKVNQNQVDKHFGPPTEWETEDQIVCQAYRKKVYTLCSVWAGPIRTVNKASPTGYQIEIKEKKGFKLKQMHTSQLKA